MKSKKLNPIQAEIVKKALLAAQNQTIRDLSKIPETEVAARASLQADIDQYADLKWELFAE